MFIFLNFNPTYNPDNQLP